jgi:peptide/nickel transport system ATP-binding protein
MKAILQVENLTTTFAGSVPGTRIRACDGIDLVIHEREFVGLVGESGCGKSTLGRTIVGLEKPSAGRVIFDGVDLATLRGAKLRSFRRAIQYIFQDPYATLNPRQTIGEALSEGLSIFGIADHAQRTQRARKLLDLVGLQRDAEIRYPRELSGGQRQRVSIARALTVEPRLLICDEPVSALDLSIRAQIMNVFLDLQQELGMACLFIAHDLALVRQAAQRTLVMYLGRIVEAGDSDSLYHRPAHPYTKALLSAVPNPDPRVERTRQRIVLEGELPSPANPPSGCRFRTRCPVSQADCAVKDPALHPSSADRIVACHYA